MRPNYMMSNPYDAYRKQGILTASPMELIVMLFDGLKKNLIFAQRAIGKSDASAAHKYLIKSQDIVTELINCLDLSIPISNDLMNIYEFLLRSFEEINLKKDADMIPQIVEIVEILRGTWQEVNEHSQKGTLSLDMEIPAESPMLDEAVSE